MKLIKWRASRDSASHFFLSATAASDSADYSADWGLSRTLFSPSLTLNTLSSTHSVVLSLFSISLSNRSIWLGELERRDKLVKRNAGELDLDGGWERVRRKKKNKHPSTLFNLYRATTSIPLSKRRIPRVRRPDFHTDDRCRGVLSPERQMRL